MQNIIGTLANDLVITIPAGSPVGADKNGRPFVGVKDGNMVGNIFGLDSGLVAKPAKVANSKDGTKATDSQDGLADQLEKLGKLLKSKVITQDDYDAAKAKLLA